MTKRIGVFGGTFNPIHIGHLHIAKEIQKTFSLTRVYFVVATVPPHKTPKDLIPFTHRYAMVSLATAGAPSFIPSVVELEPPASPFSLDTMEKLARDFEAPQNVLYFMAGGDSLAEVKTWRESERLLTSYNFIFAVRPGTGDVDPGAVLSGKAAERVHDLTGAAKAGIKRMVAGRRDATGIFILDVEAPDISATRVRQLAALGKPFGRMVPASVREYILKTHLYDGGR